MKKMTNLEKLSAIFRKSGLSISKFASIINKDRRTVTSWIDKKSNKDLSNDIKNEICKFFRYPKEIWDEDMIYDDFIYLVSKIPYEEVKIIDDGYLGGLMYKLEKERDGRLVIQSQFPGAVYRDSIVSKVYRTQNSSEIVKFKQMRKELMLSYDYQSVEWYSIKSLLAFCFSNIGNFYTKEQKLQVLELMINTFEDNYNKSLYFFDSYSRKIYGHDTIYTSIQLKQGSMFLKAPLEALFLEIRNLKLIKRVHRYFTIGLEAPKHVNPSHAPFIMGILKQVVQKNGCIKDAYELINQKSDYGELFYNNISLTLQDDLTPPKKT